MDRLQRFFDDYPMAAFAIVVILALIIGGLEW